jgi:Ca-activated chloride channel family protein
MKKSIIIIGLFLVLGLVAFVFAFCCVNPNAISMTIKDPLPNPNYTPGFTTADPVSGSSSNVSFQWKLDNPYLLRNAAGDVYLDLRVTGKALETQERKRMNLVLVIDRSGSMGSENKLEKVKEAAASIIENMNSRDLLGLVIYDDSVQTIYPSSPVENKERLRQLVYGLTPGGSTNLYGGMQQGFDEARRNFKKNYVNRIILLSDGLANVGIIEPTAIMDGAKRIRASAISVSTMGVGIDYNEGLMANIADNSGGNYYYISQEVNMAEIFRKEWNLMQSMVATNAKTTIDLGKGVQVVDVAGFQWEQEGRKLTIQVPDIYSGETKRILVHLTAPSNSLQIVDLGAGSFVCTDITKNKPEAFMTSFHPQIKVVEDQALVTKNYDGDVQSKVASVKASMKMKQAYQQLELGNTQEAEVIATSANDELKALGYASNAPQAARYDNFLKMFKTGAMKDESQKRDQLKKQKEVDRLAEQADSQ